MMHCARCRGRKKVYKVGGGYTLANNGSNPVQCPLCLGSGKNPDLAGAAKKIMEDMEEKDIQNGAEAREPRREEAQEKPVEAISETLTKEPKKRGRKAKKDTLEKAS